MTLNHSCRPNVVPAFDASTRTLQFHAVERISTASVIEYAYVTDLLEPARRRRQTLRDGFGFDCRCSRCEAECEEAINGHDDSDDQEEQQLLEHLVTLNEADASHAHGVEREIATRHNALLNRRSDLHFAYQLSVLRSAVKRQAWPAVLAAADALLAIWRRQRLPENYPMTWTLHQQIRVAALRLGDMTRAQEAQECAGAVRRICWGG
ncbi:hypothetical protein ATCC90586_001036 [Pythium insidiosum]|nr:hypothetical protein ATCC90586_001036 [Pythium insidiosum]